LKRNEGINPGFTSIFRYAPSPIDSTEYDDELVEIVEGGEVAFTLSSLGGKPDAVAAGDKGGIMTKSSRCCFMVCPRMDKVSLRSLHTLAHHVHLLPVLPPIPKETHPSTPLKEKEVLASDGALTDGERKTAKFSKAGSGSRRGYLNAGQIKLALENDKSIYQGFVTPQSVKCNGCLTLVKLNAEVNKPYQLRNWEMHKSKCPRSQGRSPFEQVLYAVSYFIHRKLGS